MGPHWVTQRPPLVSAGFDSGLVSLRKPSPVLWALGVIETPQSTPLQETRRWRCSLPRHSDMVRTHLAKANPARR